MNFKDLINMIKNSKINNRGANQAVDAYDRYRDVDRRSIKYKTRDSIAQYPILMTENVDSNNAVVIMHSLEVQYASMVSLVLHNTANTSANTAGDVVGSFHNNIDRTTGQIIANDLGQAAGYAAGFLEGVETSSYMKEANQELLLTLDDKVNHNTLNECTYTRDMKKLLETSDDDTNYDKTKIGVKDAKKANDMTPTILEVEMNMSGTKRKIQIGVKCVLHLLKTNDIEYHLSRAIYKDTALMRLVKWTTGEIGFFRGLLFSIDDAKRAADNSRGGNVDWLNKLEIISGSAKGNAVIKGGFNPAPIATLVITKQDVENIKYKHGIDLISTPANIDKIMKRFFLMNFLILDETLDIMYVYDESSKMLDRYPMRSFERISKNRKLKDDEVYNLIK